MIGEAFDSASCPNANKLVRMLSIRLHEKGVVH